MIILLNSTEPLGKNEQTNFDLMQEYKPKDIGNNSNNTNNNNDKNSVCLKRCISAKKNVINVVDGGMLPTFDDLTDENFEKEKTNSLLKMKNDLEEFYKNVMTKLNEDEKRRDEEIRLHLLSMNKHLKYLEAKKKNLEEFNYELNTYYMDIKYDFDSTDRELNREIDNNEKKNKLLIKGIEDAQKKSLLEQEINQKEYNKRSNQVASTLRNQIKTNRETGILAQKKLYEINKIYEDKIKLVKNKYDLVEAKYNQLRKNVYNDDRKDNEYYRNEFEKVIRYFRERMKEHEKYILEIKKLAEGDYDHYDNLRYLTQNKNRAFFDDLYETEVGLAKFLDEVIKAKNENEQTNPEYNNNIDEQNFNEYQEDNYEDIN